MKYERVRTAWLAAAAMAAFVALFQSGLRPPGRDTLSRPVSVDRAADGLAALATWLERDGRKVVSFREPYAKLPLRAPAARGNLLVVALPAPERVPAAQLGDLDAWLRRGNTLLVMAALADAPAWALERGASFDLSALTGLDFRRERASAADAVTLPGGAAGRGAPLLQAQLHAARVSLTHPLLTGVQTLQARSDYPRPRWTLQLPFDTAALELARDAADGRGVAWERRVGEGRVVVVGYGSLFSNRQLGAADNAVLFANLVAQRVAPDAVVLFDDGRHGLLPFYDPAQFYADPRLHGTLLILFGVWLAWVFGATALRPSVGPTAMPDGDGLTQGAADLLARVVPRAEAAERMLAACAARLRGAGAAVGIDADLPWRALESDPRVPRTDLAALRQLVDRLRAGDRVSLQTLHNLLIRIEEPLQ